MPSSSPLARNRGAEKQKSETQSESTSGLISAKFYLSTAPAPQRPYQYRPISKADVTKFPDLCSRTAKILRGRNFDFQSVDVLNVQRTDGPGLQPRLRIVVSSIKDRSFCQETIDFLSRPTTLKVAENSNLGLDIESPNPNSRFAIRPGHPFVETWSRLRDPVIRSLQGSEWKAIDVLLYGETAQRAEPTIFVTMAGQRSNGWLDLRRRIVDVVGDQVKVEESEGNVQYFTTRINDDNPTGIHPHQAYAKQVDGGWGIGVNINSTGTLGGYVKLRDQYGKNTVYALTNYHVIRPETRNFPASIDRGFKEDQLPSQFLNVYSSSEQDYETEKWFVGDRLRRLDDERRLYVPSSVQRRVKMGDASDDERAKLAYFNDRESLLQARLKLLNGLTDEDRRLGKVAYYSGFKVKDRVRLDWALVEVAHERIGVNRLPRSEEIHSDFFIQGDQIHRICDALELAAVGGEYFKIGRTTALTTGESSEIKSEVNLEVPLNDGDQGTKKRIMSSQAHVLVTPREGGPRFSMGGDSGAWVCDKFGCLAGLIWGGDGQVTYCTPIQWIIDDIETQTGMTVELA